MDLFEDLFDSLRSVLSGEKRDPLAIEIEKLGDERERVRVKAAKKLAKVGPRAVPALVAALEKTLARHVPAHPVPVVRFAGRQQVYSIAELEKRLGKKIQLSMLHDIPGIQVLEREDRTRATWLETEKHCCEETIRLLGELGQVSSDRDSLIRILIGAISNSPYSVAHAAEAALIRLGDMTTPFLLPVLQCQDVELRKKVSRILKDIEPKSPDLISALIQALSDTDKQVRLNSVLALAKAVQPPNDIGPKLPDPLSALIQALSDEDEQVRLHAIQALANAGQQAEAGIPGLMNLLSSKGKAVDEARKALVRIGPSNVATVASGLHHPEPKIRSLVADILHDMGIEGKGALSVLYSSLDDPSEEVRGKVVAAIHAIGLDAEGIPYLIRLLTDEHTWVRNHICGALAAIGAPAIPALVQGLDHENKTARENAVCALGKMGAPAAPALPKLMAALSDTEPKVQESAIEAIGNLGPSASEAVPGLLKMWSEASQELRPMVKSLGKIGAPETIDPLLKRLFGVPRCGVPNDYHEALLALVPVSSLNQKAVEWAVRASGYEHKYRGGKYDAGFITLEDSDAALASLCAVDSPVTSNLLHLVAQKRDVSVTMSTGCSNPYQEAVSFQNQRDRAVNELKKRGQPAYRPDAYLKRLGAETKHFEIQVEAEQKHERERRYRLLLSLARNPRTDRGEDKWNFYKELARDYQTMEVFQLIANDLARTRFISPSDLHQFVSLLVEIGRKFSSWEVAAALSPVQRPWPRAYTDVIEGVKKRQKT